MEKIRKTGSRDPEVPGELKNDLQKFVNQNIRPGKRVLNGLVVKGKSADRLARVGQ